MNDRRSISPSSLPTGQDTSASANTKKAPLRERSPVLAHLRSVLFAGLLTAIPLFITIAIIGFFYNFFTQYTQSPADWIVAHILGDSPSAFFIALRTFTSGAFAVGSSCLRAISPCRSPSAPSAGYGPAFFGRGRSALAAPALQFSLAAGIQD